MDLAGKRELGVAFLLRPFFYHYLDERATCSQMRYRYVFAILIELVVILLFFML